MKLSTLSVLLLVTACCSILVEVAFCRDNEAEMSNDFLRDNKAIRDYIQKADNKVKAVADIHEALLAAGMTTRAKKFMQRARVRLEKHRENRKEGTGRKDLPRRRGDVRRYRGRGWGRRGGYGRRGYGYRGGYY
ncbi:uncharacterized protein [Branchiostoma lanceolatum]|uniref:uncharacterized protein n=1 Tax=Branchiostoma lanceolatum TaxID=7740 RepID=UPI003454CCBA